MGVSPTTLRRWADEGRLPYTTTAGGHRRFDRAAIEQLVAQHEVSPGDSAQAFDLLRMLRQARIEEIRDEILALRATEEDWFAVADILGRLIAEVGRCWADGELSVIDEHLFTGKLAQSLALVAVDFDVGRDAPIGLLATVSGERHTLGLSLASLCLRSAAIDAHWIGADTPSAELVQFIGDSAEPPQLIALSASAWSTDHAMLERACREIGAVCQERGTTLLIGGKGYWPEQLEYGERCGSFADLKQALGKVGLIG